MKFNSIASRIIFSVIPIIAVSTVIFIAVIYNIIYVQINTQINDKMLESMQAARLSIQLELDDNANITGDMAIYGNVANPSSVQSDELPNFVRESIDSNENTVGGGIWFEPYAVYPDQEHYSAYAYRVDGETVVTMDYADTVDYFNEPWYVDAKNAEGRMVWSDVYYDPVADVTMVTSSQSFFDGEGNMLGVSTADMAMTDIQEIAGQISVGESGRAFIVGDHGEYISYPDGSRSVEDEIQEDADAELASLGQEVMQNESGVSQVTLDGVEESVYYSTLPDVGWKLVLLIDTSEIRASTIDLVLVMGFVPVIGLALACIAIVLVARHILRVVSKVNTFADQAASGDFSERITDLEADEFGVMEDHLNQMIYNMGELNRKSDEALQAAQAASQAKSEFLSRMSHEIRTPMNAIIGMTQIAYATDDMDKVKNCLEKTSAASKHLLSLINDILDMSKIEANKLELYSERFDLRKCIENVRSVTGVKAEEKGQTLRVEVEQCLPACLVGDEMRFAQVLTNLLGNAVKFTPEGGVVSLLITKGEETEDSMFLVCKVADNGIGISDEAAIKLFDSFEQADGGIARKFGGTGLGLAISKHIVELMGGKISVESKPGDGSTFTFTVGFGKCEEGQAEEPIPLMEEEGEPDFTGKTILLAEDIEINREVATAMLEGTHVAIDFAENGAQAVTLFGDAPQKYDIILMDVQMPEMDGFEATRRIRAMRGGEDIPILALTANAFKSDIDEALDVGMNDHIAKPIDTGELFLKLRKYLQG